MDLSGVGAWIPDRIVVYDYPRRAHPSDAGDVAGEAAARGFTVSASAVDAKLPVAVLFGDSFLARLAPFLAEDFRRTVEAQEGDMHSVHFDRKIVLAAHANVVVQELTERTLVYGARFTAFEGP